MSEPLDSTPHTPPGSARVKVYDRPSNLALALRNPRLWAATLMLGLSGAVTYYYVFAS